MSEIRADAIRALNAAAVLKESLTTLVGDDDETLRDTLEGETDLDVVIGALVQSIDDDTLLIDGCKSRLAELAERKTRFERRVEMKRQLIQQAMEIADWTRLEMSLATVSLGRKPPTLVIVEEADIPPQFFRAEPKLDKNAVLAALKDGDEVPGAMLNNGGLQLTIRRR